MFPTAGAEAGSRARNPPFVAGSDCLATVLKVNKLHNEIYILPCAVVFYPHTVAVATYAAPSLRSHHCNDIFVCVMLCSILMLLLPMLHRLCTRPITDTRTVVFYPHTVASTHAALSLRSHH
jgi:hypothetical protein